MEQTETIIKEIPRHGGELLRVSEVVFQGRKLLNIRVWYKDESDGQIHPTKKGFTIDAGQYADFIEAVTIAGRWFEQ